MKALSHPLRQRILQEFGDGRIASPKELAGALAEPIANVSYHVKTLLEYGCLELVQTRHRRGAVEHFYAATAAAWLGEEQWAKPPTMLRGSTLPRTANELLDDAASAVRDGGFDHPEVHVSRVLLTLDAEGWAEMVRVLARVLDSAVQVQRRSEARRSPGSAQEVHSELGILHFRREPAVARSGTESRKD
jgi:DNA-binding transcriptional ArsR family regulator